MIEVYTSGEFLTADVQIGVRLQQKHIRLRPNHLIRDSENSRARSDRWLLDVGVVALGDKTR
jgi:hypothetical protein